MNVLLIGGSGHVGTMTLPYMKSHHNFRVLDLNPPKDDRLNTSKDLLPIQTSFRKRWRVWIRSSTW